MLLLRCKWAVFVVRVALTIASCAGLAGLSRRAFSTSAGGATLSFEGVPADVVVDIFDNVRLVGLGSGVLEIAGTLDAILSA